MPYPWPASALTADDMATLFRVRKAATGRVTITRLIAEAVRRAYGPQPTTGAQPLPAPASRAEGRLVPFPTSTAVQAA